MSLIKEKGVPGRFTKGSVGDKYVDLDTGNEYLCTFAFGDSNGSRSDYSWKLVSTGTKDFQKKPEIKSEKIPESNFQETKPEPEPINELKTSELVKETETEEPVREHELVYPVNNDRQNRNSYSKQYKPKR